MNDETRAGALSALWVAWTWVSLLVGGGMGFVLWLLGTALAVTYAIKDEQVDKERERRRRYEDDCAKRLEEEIADGRAD